MWPLSSSIQSLEKKLPQATVSFRKVTVIVRTGSQRGSATRLEESCHVIFPQKVRTTFSSTFPFVYTFALVFSFAFIHSFAIAASFAFAYNLAFVYTFAPASTLAETHSRRTSKVSKRS